MDEHLLDIFDRIELIHWWFRGRRDILTETVSNLPKRRGRKILDIGCGSGGNYEMLSSFGTVWGIDNSQKAVALCKKKKVKRVKKADATHLPFKDNTFDFVFALDVLEHIKAYPKVAKEVKRVLKPGGFFIITSPASQFIWSKHDAMQGHVKRFEKADFKRLAKENKFQILKLKYFNFFLYPPIATVRILSRYKNFSELGEYDSKINFELANKKFINDALYTIFKTEIMLSKYVSYPIGVSLLVVYKK